MSAPSSLAGQTPQRREWRPIVQAVARGAAHIEGRLRGEGRFNYRWEHVQAVVALARWLAAETGADAEIVEAAAWLHDIAKSEADHARVGAARAREILTATDFPAAKIEAVADAIAQHEGLILAAPLALLASAVLWDADKLTKLGATGELHMLAVGFTLRPTTAEMAEEQRRWIEEMAARTVTSMNTAPARAEAVRRLEAMRAWNAALLREIGLGSTT